MSLVYTLGVCIANGWAGSAGGADAVYLLRPEQRDGAERKPGSGTCGGRDRKEAALEGERARLRVPPRQSAPPVPITEPA
jgi:hypothetical protein